MIKKKKSIYLIVAFETLSKSLSERIFFKNNNGVEKVPAKYRVFGFSDSTAFKIKLVITFGFEN